MDSLDSLEQRLERLEWHLLHNGSSQTSQTSLSRRIDSLNSELKSRLNRVFDGEQEQVPAVLSAQKQKDRQNALIAIDECSKFITSLDNIEDSTDFQIKWLLLERKRQELIEFQRQLQQLYTLSQNNSISNESQTLSSKFIQHLMH